MRQRASPSDVGAVSVPGRWRRLAFFAGSGASLGLVLFALETFFIFRSGQGLIDYDKSGIARAALIAVRPALANLLLRIAVAYGVAGATVGLATGVLAEDATRSRRGFWILWAADAAAVCLLSAWAACIARPALFEDVEPLRPVTGWLAIHGAPWQPALVTAALFALHLPWSRRRARTAMRVAVAMSLVLVPRGPALLAGRAPPRPLVVLIGLDAFRPDRIEGAERDRHLAPHLERFLQDAVRFDRAYTPLAQTEPAWAALLTASWPLRTGVRHPLTADAQRIALPTFPGAFAAAGYRTTFATDCSRFNWQGPGSGFAVRQQPPRGALNFVMEKLRYRALGVFVTSTLGSWWLPEIADNRALPGFHDPLGYARRLSDLLASEAQAGPALFAYHDTTVHYPGDVVHPFYRMRPGAPLRMSYALPGSGPIRSSDLLRREELYDELIAEADAQLGILLDRLRAEGRYDDAWIVVFSDHGEGFQPAFPALTPAVPIHGVQLSDDENRILLAFKPPARSGIATGRTVHDLVRLIDVAPTLLEAQGLRPLARADGVSLMPLLRGKSLQPLLLYAETGYTHVAPDAFDPEHFSGGPRGLDAYQVLPGGAVFMSERAHQLALREKDVGAFDGRGWLIRSLRADGSVAMRCRGDCSPELAGWLDRVARPGAPEG
jgi:sulfatase-like protein